MDAEINELKSKLTEVKGSLKALQSEHASLTASLPTTELAAKVKQMQGESVARAAKLNELRAGTRRIDPVEKGKVDAKYAIVVKEAKKRKKLCMNAMSALLEGMEGIKGGIPEFAEMIGAEMD